MVKFITFNIIFILAFIFNILIMGWEDISVLILVAIFSYIIFYWLYFIRNSSSKKITKESDEIIHPVVETIVALHICNIQKLYGKNYNKKYVEKCDCGSTIFRIYNEDTNNGTYVQFICAKCNTKATGYEFNWKTSQK